MEGTHAVGRQPFMPDSTLSRRSVALHARLAKYPSGNHKIIPRIVISNAALIAEILWIWACVDSPDRDDEPKAISGSNFATTPCVHQRNVALRSHQGGIGF